MGHRISALIGKCPIDEEQAHAYDLPFFYEGQFVIVALDASHNDYWTEQIGLEYEKLSAVFLDNPCTHYLANKLGLDCFTIIYTDYFGGAGHQFAVAYRNNKKILKSTENGINKGLKKIGVKRTFTKDHFDVLGLGNYRNWDNYFEKYQDR